MTPDRGPRLFGRELDSADTAVTVRVREDLTRVTAGPVTEASEFLTGLDVIECADLDAAVAAIAGYPVSGSDETPYLLLGWIGPDTAAAAADRGLIDALELWRRAVDGRGRYVMGSAFGGIEAVTTLRLRDERTREADSPIIEVAHRAATIDVVLATDRRQAIELASTHPLARGYAVEVRAFRS